ncbi:hypothetical protein MMC07_003146 [Pseudocyphellaria aurata]|nr:hypothetical protein [Pseudocyphellaria aurata]
MKAGLVSSESDHAATVRNFNIDLESFESGDLSQQLLADEASPPSTVTSHDLPVRRRAAGSSNITEVDSIELAQSRSESDAISQVSSDIIVGRRHIHWFSPALMTGLFVAGVFFAIGHHSYYESLNGQEVGDMKRQQWPLRFGNVFSFLVKSCLAASAGIACVQWMWKTLRRSYITIEGIDAAFSAQENLLSLLNWEMLSKMRIGTFIALMTWCIPFATLITPATLSVRPTYQYIETPENVASLNISTFKLSNNSSPSPKELAFLTRFAELDYDTSFVGPSLLLARIASASAATGDIFRIAKPLPGPNMTYQIGLHIPAIKCENSSSAVARNTTAAAVIAAGAGGNSSVPFDFGALDMSLLRYDNISYGRDNRGNYFEITSWLSIGYFAMIPQYDERMNRPWDRDGDGYALNQLWIVVADHDDVNSTNPLFLTCTLWNVSSFFNISYKDDVQSVQRENFTYVNEVEPDTHLWGTNPTYTAFFRAVCDQLVGLIAVFSYEPYLYSVRNEANIKATTLAGASEFVLMMRNLSQRIMQTRSRYQEDLPSLNKSLSALIEELSLNSTINLLSDSSLSTLTSANVTYPQPRFEYSYEYHNLVLAYGLAIFFALLCILLGWSAIISNGMSYDFTVSSIIGTSQNPDVGHSPVPWFSERTTYSCSPRQLADLFRQQTPGAQPLDRQIRKTRLRFGAVAPRLRGNSAGLPVQRAAFGLEGTVSQLQKNWFSKRRSRAASCVAMDFAKTASMHAS